MGQFFAKKYFWKWLNRCNCLSVCSSKKYNLLCAIKYGKIVGIRLYPELNKGIGAKELCIFIDDFITGKYNGNTIILDNASFHRSKLVKDKIYMSKNKLLHSIPYHPETNPIEEFFSQLKHYIKLESPQSYNEIAKTISKIVKKYVKIKHLENYFRHLQMRTKNIN
jgi:transposase